MTPARVTPRDSQRSRVYRWEDATIAPLDSSRLPLGLAAGVVRAIWAELGLRFPPAVEPLPNQARHLADATRLTIRLRDPSPSWCLLHELAHSLTSTHDGRSDGHGALFMASYLRLLTRYLRLDAALLHSSAARFGLRVGAMAAPVFVDPPKTPISLDESVSQGL